MFFISLISIDPEPQTCYDPKKPWPLAIDAYPRIAIVVLTRHVDRNLSPLPVGGKVS